MTTRLPAPPPVPAEAREVALTTPPPRYYGTLADDLRTLDRVYHAPCCAGCGAPDGVPCVDDECSGHADPDAVSYF